MNKQRIYASIIEQIFHSKFKPGMRELDFERLDIGRFAKKLRVALPKNLGDLVYRFRYRQEFPESIQFTAGKEKAWIIRPAGRSRYRFVLVPDATPGVIAKYAWSDEQALLAKLRYNGLVDIFSGVTCYSWQNHLRTTVPQMGQVETDELYVGLDKQGVHYVFPVQAKGGKEQTEHRTGRAGHGDVRPQIPVAHRSSFGRPVHAVRRDSHV